MIANFASRNVGHVRIEQRSQHASQARFRLSSQSEQDEVVARQHRVDDLRDDGIVESHDAREERFAALQLADEVRSQLFFYRSIRFQ